MDSNKKAYVATVSTSIKATPGDVWEALTNPKLLKKYFFGTDVKTDWRKGSLITYRGEWEGKTFEDKGYVLDVIPEKLLLTNFLSASSGDADVPENYHIVKYELMPEGEGTRLVLTQDNNKSEEAKTHSEKNWKIVFDSLKKMLETRNQ